MNLLEENEVKITKQRSMRNIFLIGNKVLAQSKRWESPREADLHCQWEVGALLGDSQRSNWAYYAAAAKVH